MAEVAKVRTPLEEIELARALHDGHILACGGPPTLARWSGMWAQCALEHGRGKALDCYCLGNVTAGKSWSGDYYTLDCPERIQKNPDVWKVLHLWFRAFLSSVAGAKNYIELLAGRYARALAKIDRGDYGGAALVLSEMGYYTADAAKYSAAMRSLGQYAETKLLPPLMTEHEPAMLCQDADCSGEMRSLLSAEEIERVLSVQFDLTQIARDSIDEAEAEQRRTRPDSTG